MLTNEEISQVPIPSNLTAQGVDFRELVMNQAFGFRTQKKLRRKIEEAFLNGLGEGIEDFKE